MPLNEEERKRFRLCLHRLGFDCRTLLAITMEDVLVRTSRCKPISVRVGRTWQRKYLMPWAYRIVNEDYQKKQRQKEAK
jgi:hypothetical protein